MHAMLQDAINRLVLWNNGAECMSASSDGSVILWDLTTCKRRITVSARTFFNDAAFCRDGSQVVTAGAVQPFRVLFSCLAVAMYPT